MFSNTQQGKILQIWEEEITAEIKGFASVWDSEDTEIQQMLFEDRLLISTI